MSGYCKDCNTYCEKIKTRPVRPSPGFAEMPIREYCAYCLPAKYITKPIKEWICNSCNGRKNGGY